MTAVATMPARREDSAPTPVRSVVNHGEDMTFQQRLKLAENGLEKGALAGAVGANQGGALAALELHVFTAKEDCVGGR